jgi:DNA primase
VLLSELNKILIRERRERENDFQKARTAPITPAVVEDLYSKQPLDQQMLVQYQEKETIRLLLNFSENKVEDDSVSDFLLHELEDVEFTNPVYKDIYNTYKTRISKGEPVDSSYFLAHSSNEVKKTVTELITSRYSTSSYWNDKYHIYIPKEDDIIGDLALTNVIRLKFRVVQKMMEDNLKQLKAAEQKDDWDLLVKHLTMQQNLKEAEKELAGKLGIVVAK